jgi:hypothetical protein
MIRATLADLLGDAKLGSAVGLEIGLKEPALRLDDMAPIPVTVACDVEALVVMAEHGQSISMPRAAKAA